MVGLVESWGIYQSRREGGEGGYFSDCDFFRVGAEWGRKSQEGSKWSAISDPCSPYLAYTRILIGLRYRGENGITVPTSLILEF